MYYLVKTAGLDLSMYVGSSKEGNREGHGIQYFSNGYKFTGFWQGNRANGHGKLEYTDGTFYEGTFKDNYIIEGILSFYNGAKYIGKFCDDERKERFLEGSFIFTDGDMLKTTWNNGIPRAGSYITKEGKTLKVSENEKSVFLNEDDPSKGKIIMANSTEIYEGGIKERIINGKGVIYSSFPHYEEAFYTAGKPNGQYVCNYINGGYCYEGNFKNGQRVGKWKYQTAKGYFYEGEANLKSGKVTFPYMNDDHYVGDVDIQFHNMILMNGTYNVNDGLGKSIQIPVQNLKSLLEIPEVKNRKFPLSDFTSRFQKSKISNQEPILNGVHTYSYPDGSYFRGNFNYDFIYIHKRDLLNCYFLNTRKKSPSNPKTLLTIVETLKYRQDKSNAQVPISGNSLENSQENNEVFFQGTKHKGIKEGFCVISFKDSGVIIKAAFKNNKPFGKGKLLDANGNISIGNFVNGELDGNVVVLLPNLDRIYTKFVKGIMNTSSVIIKKDNGLIYTGDIQDFKKHGSGELLYTNGFKFKGNFTTGEIDTSRIIGKIVTPSLNEFDCIYTTVAGRNIGILETIADGEVYVYNSAKGSLRQAQ